MRSVERSKAVVHCRLVRGGLLESCVVVDDGVVLALVVEAADVVGVAVELVSVVDDVVPATDNTARLDLPTTAR